MTRETISCEIAEMIAEAMYMDTNDVEQDELFSSFGLESLTLTRIVGEINRRYGLELRVVDVLQHQTLRQTSTLVVAALACEEQHRAQ